MRSSSVYIAPRLQLAAFSSISCLKPELSCYSRGKQKRLGYKLYRLNLQLANYLWGLLAFCGIAIAYL